MMAREARNRARSDSPLPCPDAARRRPHPPPVAGLRAARPRGRRARLVRRLPAHPPARDRVRRLGRDADDLARARGRPPDRLPDLRHPRLVRPAGPDRVGRVPAQRPVGDPRGDRPGDAVRDRPAARRPAIARRGDGPCPRRRRHGLGGRHRRRGQPAPPAVLRAAHPSGTGLGGGSTAARPRARRSAHRPVRREPPPDPVRRPVRGRVRPVGRPSRAHRPTMARAPGPARRGPRRVGLPVHPAGGRRVATPPLQPPEDVRRRLVAGQRTPVPRPVRLPRREGPEHLRRVAGRPAGPARRARDRDPAAARARRPGDPRRPADRLRADVRGHPRRWEPTSGRTTCDSSTTCSSRG